MSNEAKNLGDAVVDRETRQGFTPGPWRADSSTFPRIGQVGEWWAVYEGDADHDEGELIAEISRTAGGSIRDVERERANARLIAAAPALYEALRNIAER